MPAYCNLEIKNNHAVLSFGSDKQNALSSDLLKQMISHLQSLDHNENIKVILIQSAGEKTFCAGADLGELLSIENEKVGTEFFSLFASLVLTIRKSPHIVLVKVQGKAVGGALGIIAAADYSIASTTAQIRLSELLNGIGPFVVGPAIARKVGLSAFYHMTLNPSRWFDGNYAMEKSFFNEVTDDQLEQGVQNKINELSSYSSSALREIKKMMWSNEPSWDDLLHSRAAISGKLIVSNESRMAFSKLRKA